MNADLGNIQSLSPQKRSILLAVYKKLEDAMNREKDDRDQGYTNGLLDSIDIIMRTEE